MFPHCKHTTLCATLLYLHDRLWTRRSVTESSLLNITLHSSERNLSFLLLDSWHKTHFWLLLYVCEACETQRVSSCHHRSIDLLSQRYKVLLMCRLSTVFSVYSWDCSWWTAKARQPDTISDCCRCFQRWQNKTRLMSHTQWMSCVTLADIFKLQQTLPLNN